MKRATRLPACLLVFFLLLGRGLAAGPPQVPAVHSNMFLNDRGVPYVRDGKGRRFELKPERPRYSLRMARGNPAGTAKGLAFDFSDPAHGLRLEKGTLYYGLIKQGDGRYPLPVFHKDTVRILEGKAEIAILEKLKGRYDMIGWQARGRGMLGYRVADGEGRLLYDGKIAFTGRGPFRVEACIIEGPFLCKPGPTSVTLAFETNVPCRGRVLVAGQTLWDSGGGTDHEIEVTGLTPDTVYAYTVSTDQGAGGETHRFRTPPGPGARKPFSLAYASDSRAGRGGGERDVRGVNAYMMKRIMALTCARGAAFLQFTGDMIYGYRNNPQEIFLEYANWKRAIEPWAGSVPVIAGMGNHEAFIHAWTEGSEDRVAVDRFPYDRASTEAAFARVFVNPENGPESEDGAAYDPDPDRTDFPSYRENVFYYTYDNIAMVVLNSDYWYAYTLPETAYVGGNLHGYLMDNQMAWLERTLDALEADENLDFVFVTLHAPVFPNAGHVADGMWYQGSNEPRAYVAGRPLAKGILERRDEFWRMLMEHGKVVAVLTGDDHNYSRLEVREGVRIHDEKRYAPERPPALFRPIWQINNGAAGAPYHSREKTPWYDHLQGFTTQNALVFFQVHGKSLEMEVINPVTLEEIDSLELAP